MNDQPKTIVSSAPGGSFESREALVNKPPSTRVIGPVLPPGFGVALPKNDKIVTDKLAGDNKATCIGPALPPKIPKCVRTNTDTVEICRPTVGPHKLPTSALNISNDGENSIGPSLPPHLKLQESIGPCLPPGSSRKAIGPILPGTIVSDDSEDEYIGPKIFEAADVETQNRTTAASDFERRAEKMKNKLLSKGEEVKKREEWMTELPSRLGTQIGLGPRSFKKHAYTGKEDDRSEWTDTPADRERKAQMETSSDVQGPSTTEILLHKRNEDIKVSLDKYNKVKRKESLLEIHQKKKKRKDKDRPKERREFDRDSDLDIKKFDAAQAKKFVDKARLFNTKFSHGSSHFL